MIDLEPNSRASEREHDRARRVLDRIADAMLAADGSGRLSYANGRAAALLRSPAPSLPGRNLLTDFPAVLGPLFALQFRSAWTTQRGTTLEFQPDPSGGWLEASLHPDEGGVSVCLRDITARKEAEAALRRRNRAFVALAEHAPDVIQRFDGELRFLYTNPAVEHETGLSPMLFLGRTHADPVLGLPAVLADLWQAELAAVFRTRLPREFAVEYQGPHGVRWFDVRLVPEFDPQGQVESVLAVSRNVTAQRRAEAGLRESEERFRALSMSSPLGIFQTDTEGRVLYANPRGQAIWEAAEGELLGAGWLDHVHPEDLPELLACWEAALASHRECDLTYRLLLPDGRIKHIRACSAPLRDGTGTVIGCVGTTRDVTERKQIEAALAESERSLRLALQAGGMVAWEHDLATGMVSLRAEDVDPLGAFGTVTTPRSQDWSAVFQDGRSAPFADLLQDLHPQDRERFVAACEQAIGSKTEFNQEVRLRRRDGQLRWWKLIGRTVLGPDGWPERTIGVGLDITEEKEADERIAHSEARLAALVSSASDAIVTLDADGRVIRFNPAAEQIFGIPAAEMLGEGLERILPPEVRELHASNLERFVRSHKAQRPVGVGRIRGLRGDGQEIVLEASIAHAEAAGCRELTAILRDVTERVRAERERRQYQHELSALTQRLLEQEQETNRRVAQHLHDDLGQTLCALRLIHDSGMRRLARQRNPDDWLRSAGELIVEANRKVRQVLTDLRPVLLEDVGLQAAMENEILQPFLAGRKPQTRFDWRPQVAAKSRWPATVEYAFFMVMREAYGNALRHAGARNVLVRVTGDEAGLVLDVEDDGTGSPGLESVVRPGHLGLVSMRERAKAIGAALEIRSDPQRGTRIRMAWSAGADEARAPAGR